ncbi:MAG TPA: hypothetical protein VMW78_02515 [Anaerolineae bacterium]|nr:hypothetical protein [Anaerolineae bacterium]
MFPTRKEAAGAMDKAKNSCRERKNPGLRNLSDLQKGTTHSPTPPTVQAPQNHFSVGHLT